MVFSRSAIAMLLVLMVSLSGCQIIGDIFKAGVWVGILLVVVVVAVIVWMLRKIKG